MKHFKIVVWLAVFKFYLSVSSAFNSFIFTRHSSSSFSPSSCPSRSHLLSRSRSSFLSSEESLDRRERAEVSEIFEPSIVTEVTEVTKGKGDRYLDSNIDLIQNSGKFPPSSSPSSSTSSTFTRSSLYFLRSFIPFFSLFSLLDYSFLSLEELLDKGEKAEVSEIFKRPTVTEVTEVIKGKGGRDSDLGVDLIQNSGKFPLSSSSSSTFTRSSLYFLSSFIPFFSLFSFLDYSFQVDETQPQSQLKEPITIAKIVNAYELRDDIKKLQLRKKEEQKQFQEQLKTLSKSSSTLSRSSSASTSTSTPSLEKEKRGGVATDTTDTTTTTPTASITSTASTNENSISTKITNIVDFTIRVGQDQVGQIKLGLFGEAAPESVETMLRLVSGNNDEGVTYEGATIFKIDQALQKIDVGRISGGAGKRLENEINSSGTMRIKRYNAADWTYNSDINNLSHGLKPYLVSATKFGGCYEFSITMNGNQNQNQKSNTNTKNSLSMKEKADRKKIVERLDRENIVIGEVIVGSDFIDEIAGKVPYSKDDPFATKTIYAGAGKGFDSRAKIQYLGKPLKKILIQNAVIEK